MKDNKNHDTKSSSLRKWLYLIVMVALIGLALWENADALFPSVPEELKPTTSKTVSEPVKSVSGYREMNVSELPGEALDTLKLIKEGGTFPYSQDNTVFSNREGLLPKKSGGYYREYTVKTPGSPDRGARRIVAGEGGEYYYTSNHYLSFRLIVE